jgi:hypothetical protein
MSDGLAGLLGRICTARRVGIALIVLSLVAGLPQLYWSTFIDEADNLATGVWLAQGRVLYRDVFSHHFPFPYHWSEWVAATCGASMGCFRSSMLVFQTAMFALAAVLTPFPIAVGITALVWRAIGYPYYGNLLIYSNFTAAALLVVNSVTLAAVASSMRLMPRHCLALGVLSALAILADPMAVYPVLASLIVLARRPRDALTTGAILAACLACYLGYLLLNGAWSAFVADVVRFNTDVYSTYRRLDAVPTRQMLGTALRGLDLFDRRWLHVSFAMVNVQRPDRWLATGCVFRAAIVVCAITLLVHRRIAAGIFVYTVACLQLATMGDERFRANPLILLALFAAALCATGEWRTSDSAPAHTGRRRRGEGALALGLSVTFGLALLWLFGWGTYNIVAHRRDLSYAANFSGHEQRARMLRRLGCDRDDVPLLDYPSAPLSYLFSGMRPASRYAFMLPWIARIGLSEVISDLGRTAAVVSIDLNGAVWGHRNREYLAPLIQFLDTQYVQVLPGTYVAPALAAQCPLSVGDARVD